MVLLERGEELATISRTLRQGGVLLVEGGSGIGKTSLLDSAAELAEAAGQEVLRAKASELESEFAFGIVLQLFERRVALTSPAKLRSIFGGPAAAARPLFTGAALTATDSDVSFAALHGLYWLAANLAARRPLLLAVDDLHWVDRPSLRWLAYVAPRLQGLPITLVATLRRVDSEPADAPIMAIYQAAVVLTPALLSESATAQIVRDVVGAAGTEALCGAVWEESGGNPFYLRELLRAGDVSAVALPRGELVRQVAARVQRLDPRALRLAQALALLGDGCELRHAAAIAETDMGTAAALANGLVRLEILSGDSPPRFLHPVLREVLEASLGSDTRDSGHRAAAALLHAEGAPAGRVGAHLTRVRPSGDPWVAARLREAARSTLASGAPQAAADLLRRALQEPPAQVERVPLLREAAAAESLAGREAACGLLEDALGLVTAAEERAEIGLQLAEARANLYQWEAAVDVCDRALAELGDRDSPLAPRLEAELAVCALRQAPLARRALPVLKKLGGRRLDRTTAEAFAIAQAMADHMIEGRSAADIAPRLKTALQAAGPRAESWDLRLPGLVTLIWLEAFDDVEELLQPMLADVRSSGSARGLHVVHVTIALLKLVLGALPEADAAARVALGVLQAAEFHRGLPLVTSILAGIATEAGQLEEAEALIETLPPASLPASLPALRLFITRAQLRLAQGRPGDALAELEACQAAYSPEVWGVEMRDNGLLHIRSATAHALLLLGQRERALELAEEELKDARAFGAPRALGRSLRIAGLARGGEAGVAALEESVSVLRSSPALLERARSLLELGAAWRRLGRRAAAREPLSEALEIAARCGARQLAESAREELKATGARPRREWRTGVEALTPGELRVARLAAGGNTNRRIAQQLYLTVKTVESHLAHVYAKLGAAGRAELASWFDAEKIRVPTR